MNPNANDPKPNDPNANDLRQQLLEYYFDCHPDPDAIARRLGADPEFAALYDEVQRTATLLEDAAVATAPDIEFASPAPRRRPGLRGPGLRGLGLRGLGFRHAWYAAAALAGIAVLPCLGIYAYRAWTLRSVENGHLRLLLSAPPAIPDGTPLRFHVETHNLAQKKIAAQVAWQVLDDQGGVLSASTTDCDGATDITVAGTLDKPRKLVVTASLPGTGFSQTVSQPLHPSSAAPLIHITSDRPAYRPGEPVLLRLACLDRLTLRGIDRLGLRCRIVGPRDSAVAETVLGVGQGVTAWTWQVPPSAVGGTYALEVRDEKNTFALERHEFLVRNFQPPRLQKKVVLDRQTYAPGAGGTADLHVTRAGGGAAAGAKVHATLVVDGIESWQDDAVLDADGRALFRFDVPGNVLQGAARFVARVTDGGTIETVLEPFVVPTGKVEVALYPEGGDLVAGSENRVYAQVSDPLGRPLSSAGEVVDDTGTKVADFATAHMGRARFAFTPVAGRSYELRLTVPKRKTVALPAVHTEGVVLRATGDSIAAGQPAEARVFTAGPGPWIAAVFCRGTLVGQQSILIRGASTVRVPMVAAASGVLRLTVFDHKLRPVAERLVQREAERRLAVTVQMAADRLAPGAKQKITVKTTDENGEPQPCVVGLTVTDRAVADMTDFIRTGLADQQQLWTDAEKLEDKVEEFLAGTAAYRRNIDLLLGCMGWRRYVWRNQADPAALVAAGGEWARSLPAREGRSWAPLVTDTLGAHQTELDAARWSRSRARNLLATFAAWALAGLLALAWVHGLVLARRWFGARPIPVFGTMVASILLVGTPVFSLFAFGASGRLAAPDSGSAVPRTSAVATGFDNRRPGRELLDEDGGVDPGERLSFGYVRDFDVEVAQGASHFGHFRHFDIALGTTASDEQTLLDFGLVGQPPAAAGFRGGAYRGPVDFMPPRANPARLVDRLMQAQMRRTAAALRVVVGRGGSGDTTGTASQALTLRLQDELTESFRGLRQANAILGYVRTLYPDLLGTDTPLVTGSVTGIDAGVDAGVAAGGTRLELSFATATKDLKPGMQLDVFDARDGFKGLAAVTEVAADGRTCVARLTSASGKPVAIRDLVATNLVADTAKMTPARRKQLATILANPQLAAVVYRYQHEQSSARTDFTETLFWQPFLVTDAKGEATVEFDVSSSVTTWSVFADAHGHGRVGQAAGAFDSFLPFALDIKVPARVQEGDIVRIPISVVAEDQSQKTASVVIQSTGPLAARGSLSREVPLRDGRGRVLAEFAVGAPQGAAVTGSISVQGSVAGARDVVTRTMTIQPRGFPRSVDRGGKVKGAEKITLHVPDDLARRTAQLSLRFYPSPLADLEGAVQGMLREPHGCFEQVSSSNYPNVMVLSLLENSGDDVPAAAAQANRLLASGYGKLTGYEVDGGGFEWWGKKPAHAALTAYGLLQFTDMARVFDGVDPAMVARTRTWLLGKRDGKGSFVTGGGRYGHFMGGSAEARSAYISYALLYAGEPAGRMAKELTFLARRAAATANAYELAVAACALAKAEHPAAAAARGRLVGLQEKDGSLLGTGSITDSGERDLRIETTAFAVLAWLAADGRDGQDGHDGAVQRGIQFLEKQRQGGGHFGGTQATVMALRAITAYLAANTRSVQPGKLSITLNGKTYEREIFGSEKRAIEFDNLAAALVAGDNALRITLSGGNEFPFGLELRYRADEPQSSPRCAVELRTWLAHKQIVTGGTTALHAVVTNTVAQPVSNPMVLVGLPAGLHVDAKILDDLKAAATIASWELTDQTIILYLRGLEANEARDIVIDLTGRIPGTTKGPASRAYLYYAAQEKCWTAPVQVTVGDR